jgi:nucleoporin NDC1
MMATSVLFGLCYVESLLIGEWNSCKPSVLHSAQCNGLTKHVVFWSWFPFGRAGIRTGLLFIPAFMIFILRVAQLHVGLRTSYSGWQTFRSYGLKFQVIQTIGWYSLSAYLFSEIYIWSVSKDADLNRIKLIPKTGRTTLNEKPIYLTSFFFFLALVQSAYHLFYDYDRIDMPITKTKPDASSDQRAYLVVPPTAQLKTILPSLIQDSLKRVVLVAVLSPMIYSIKFPIYPYSVRSFAWSFTRSWAKVFWSLPKSSLLPSIRPFHWSVLMRTVTAGFLLVMLWEVGNAAFSTYVAQEPLKNERPITYESRDPNGSLLTGLKGKKLQTRVSLTLYYMERFY